MEKRAARTSWPVVLLIVLACTGFAVLLSYLITGAGVTQVGAAVPLGLRASLDVNVLDDGVIYYDGAMIGALDANGNLKWNYSAGINAKYDVSQDGVATWTDTSLSFIESGTGATMYSGATTMPVLSATVGSRYAAAMLGTEETSAQLLIYELTGRQIDQIDLAGQIVMDFGFFSNGALLWVMTMDTSGSVPMSIITTYQPGRQTLGSVREIEEVVYRTLFQASQLRAVGTTYIKTYDYAGSEITSERKLVYGWYMEAVEENVSDPLMALVPVAQSDAMAQISDVKLIQGSTERLLRMPFPCDAIFCRAGTLYGFSDSAVMICRAGETRARAYQLPIVVDGVVGVTSANTAIVESAGELYTIALP